MEAPKVDLRDVHQAETRRRILQAVNELLADEHPAALSVPAVAKRSGISRATIYRHFPTKEALLDAAAHAIDEETHEWLGDDAPAVGGKLNEFVHRSWAEMARHLPAVRASHLSPLGHELRQRRGVDRIERARGTVRSAGIDPETPEGARAVRLLLALASSSTLLEQVDRMGQDVEEAADDVVWAVETIVRATREALSPAEDSI